MSFLTSCFKSQTLSPSPNPSLKRVSRMREYAPRGESSLVILALSKTMFENFQTQCEMNGLSKEFACYKDQIKEALEHSPPQQDFSKLNKKSLSAILDIFKENSKKENSKRVNIFFSNIDKWLALDEEQRLMTCNAFKGSEKLIDFIMKYKDTWFTLHNREMLTIIDIFQNTDPEKIAALEKVFDTKPLTIHRHVTYDPKKHPSTKLSENPGYKAGLTLAFQAFCASARKTYLDNQDTSHKMVFWARKEDVQTVANQDEQLFKLEPQIDYAGNIIEGLCSMVVPLQIKIPPTQEEVTIELTIFENKDLFLMNKHSLRTELIKQEEYERLEKLIDFINPDSQNYCQGVGIVNDIKKLLILYYQQLIFGGINIYTDVDIAQRIKKNDNTTMRNLARFMGIYHANKISRFTQDLNDAFSSYRKEIDFLLTSPHNGLKIAEHVLKSYYDEINKRKDNEELTGNNLNATKKLTDILFGFLFMPSLLAQSKLYGENILDIRPPDRTNTRTWAK